MSKEPKGHGNLAAGHAGVPAPAQPTMAGTTEIAGPSVEEMTDFARRHGLGTLRPEYIARMCTLVEPVARFGQQVRRPPRKEDGPAPTFEVL
ncbi:MAG: hypothetical protein WCP99_12170 [Burkholderiales bacterium]